MLIVGDDATVTDEVSRVLRLSGCEVWAAASRADGLTLAPRHRPDVVLVDLRTTLPVALGFARSVQALPEHAGRPIEVVTADYWYVPGPDEVASGISLHYRPIWVNELVALARGRLGVPIHS